MNVTSFSFTPYRLVEYFAPEEAPQMVVKDNVVHFKHCHKSLEEIENDFPRESDRVQVEIEYINTLIEKTSDENVVFALNKLLVQEELLLAALMPHVQRKNAKAIDFVIKKLLSEIQNPTQQLSSISSHKTKQ